MSIASHALLIGTADAHPLVGEDVMAEALKVIAQLGGEDAIEGCRLVGLDEAGQEVADLTEELAFTLSHSSPIYSY